MAAVPAWKPKPRNNAPSMGKFPVLLSVQNYSRCTWEEIREFMQYAWRDCSAELFSCYVQDWYDRQAAGEDVGTQPVPPEWPGNVFGVKDLEDE